MDHFQLIRGELHCEDVALSDIAARVGTPVYVYSTATMCRHVAALREALEPLADPLIAYAVKANPNSAVIATLAKAGLGADVVSGGEYRRAQAAGVPADKIVFSGVGKTETEMRLALDGGLYQFNLESLAEAEMLSAVAVAMGRTARVGFRVNRTSAPEATRKSPLALRRTSSASPLPMRRPLMTASPLSPVSRSTASPYTSAASSRASRRSSAPSPASAS